MKFNWLGHLGRKYTAQLLLFVTSTTALFTGFCDFTSWAGFNLLSFFGYGIMNFVAKKPQ